jgi:hypothetical protein
VWTRYGIDDATAAWDKLAVVQSTSLTNTAMNVAKTYACRVQACNGAGFGPVSADAIAGTPIDLPLPPDNLQYVSSTATTIDMSWVDVSDNEIGWSVYRQEVPPRCRCSPRSPASTAPRRPAGCCLPIVSIRALAFVG